MITDAVSVSELTYAIKGLLEEGIGEVVVSGEISNFKAHSSGHRYFSLKDADAQISAVMWKTRPLSFVPEDGMHVRVRARLSVYPPQGRYQLDVQAMKPEGVGDLYKAFEKLKESLKAQGFFDEEHKKSLPDAIAKVGIVTSITGAALQDMLSTIQRRWPLLDVLLRPTKVQGDGAAQDIAAAIRQLDAQNLDAIIVGRGGGSIEDLWCFNTELVARAIYTARTPIISAVGHETDVTISDFVADKRAETPTAAAVMVTPVTRDMVVSYLHQWRTAATSAVNDSILTLADVAGRFHDGRAARRITERIMLRQQRIDDVTLQSQRSILRYIERVKHRVEHLRELAGSHHPLTPLRKGYAVILRNGAVLRPTDTLQPGERVTIQRSQERSEARITTTNPSTPLP